MKKVIKNNYKKKYEKIDLLEDLKMSLLNFNFVIIYIIYAMLVLFKNNLNYFKESIFKCFFRSIINFEFFLKKITFFITYNSAKFKS